MREQHVYCQVRGAVRARRRAMDAEETLLMGGGMKEERRMGRHKGEEVGSAMCDMEEQDTRGGKEPELT